MDFHLLVRSLLERNERAGDLPWAQPKNARGLAKLLAGKVAERSVYDFLNGKNVRTETLFAILEAMQVDLRVSFRFDGVNKVFRPEFDTRLEDSYITKAALFNEVKRLSHYSSIESAIEYITKQNPK